MVPVDATELCQVRYGFWKSRSLAPKQRLQPVVQLPNEVRFRLAPDFFE